MKQMLPKEGKEQKNQQILNTIKDFQRRNFQKKDKSNK